jgi:hypothetical protein
MIYIIGFFVVLGVGLVVANEIDALTGWKTRIFTALLALGTALQASGAFDIVSSDAELGALGAGTAFIVFLLRQMTTTPPGRKF